MNQTGQHNGSADSIRRTRTVNSTLLEFPGKRAGQKNAPEWREEIKNRVKLRKEGKTGDLPDASEIVNAQPIEPIAHAEPALVISLKPKIAEPKQTPPSSIAARALERVARSRQQFEQFNEGAESNPKNGAATMDLQTDVTPLTLVPSAAALAKPARRVLPAIEDDSIIDFDDAAAEETFVVPKNDQNDFSERATANYQDAAFEQFEIPVSRRKNVELETARETIETFEDLEDEDSIAASLSSVRKTVVARSAALDEQQPATRATAASNAARNRNKQQSEDFAPLGARFVAGAIDLTVGALAAGALAYAFGLWHAAPAANSGAGSGFWQVAAVFVIVEFFYLTALLLLSGTTLGLKAFRLGVVAAEDGYIPTLAQAALNSLVYLLVLATGGIGLLTVFFSSEKRALQDIAAGTIVVTDGE